MGWTGIDPEQWANQAIERVGRVVQVIAEEMANSMATSVRASGFTPVDTGNLSRSVTISTTPISRDDPGYNSPIRQDYGQASKAITDDGSFYIAYKAFYAHRVNYGFVGTDSLGRSYNQSGRGFLESNVARFRQVSNKAVSRLTYED